MKHSYFFLLIISALFLVPQVSYSQKKSETDSIYEKLKKKDINKMTQREYEYFMLMKRKEVAADSQAVEKQGIVTGVVTYFFNRNYGDKPDVGSEVFILPEKYKDKWIEVLMFVSEVLSRTNAELDKMLGNEHSRQLMSESEFDNLESGVNEFIKQIRYDKLSDIKKVVADGGGAFSITVAPGNYYFIARSAHRSSHSNKVEFLAQIYVASEEVKAGQTTFVKFRFQAR